MEEKIKKVLRITPELRGSEIAKKIGVEKRKVNSFLNVNRDKFFQNSDHRWSNIAVDETVVEFESGRWIDCPSFESSLYGAGPLLDSESSSVVFVLPKNCKMLLAVTARLLALCNQLVEQGKQVTIDFECCPSSLTYLDRIGFLDHLCESIIIKPERPNSSRATIYKGNSNAVVEMDSIDPQEDENKALIIRLTEACVEEIGEAYHTPISSSCQP